MKNSREKKEALVKALRKSMGNITLACRAVGISRPTFYRWLEKDHKLKEECVNIEEEAIDFVENKLFGRINANDTTAIIFYLKTKGKKRGYVEKQEMEIEGHGERPVIIFEKEEDDA